MADKSGRSAFLKKDWDTKDLSECDVLKPLREKFATIDKSGSGTISKTEFAHALKAYDIRLHADDLDLLFDRFDVANTGQIDIIEFTTVLGQPLVRDKSRSIESVFLETVQVMLQKIDSKSAQEQNMNSQFDELFKKVGVDSWTGTLDFKSFMNLMCKECDWSISEQNLRPLFDYLDLNNNQQVSVITIRFMVKDLAKQRSPDRSIFVIDILKEAMVRTQGDMIRAQKRQLEELKKNGGGNPTMPVKLGSAPPNPSVKILDDDPDDRPIEEKAEDIEMVQHTIERKKARDAGMLWDQILSWPMFTFTGYFGIFVCMILAVFFSDPMGDLGYNISMIVWSEMVICAIAAVHFLIVWPVWRDDLVHNHCQVITSILFTVNGICLVVIGLIVFTPTYYKSRGCYECLPCQEFEGICHDQWRLVGGQDDSCVCALSTELQAREDNPSWDTEGLDWDDCAGVMEYLEKEYPDLDGKLGDYDCVWYEGGSFTMLGWAILAFGIVAVLSACWGSCIAMKDLHPELMGCGDSADDEDGDDSRDLESDQGRDLKDKDGGAGAEMASTGGPKTVGSNLYI